MIKHLNAFLIMVVGILLISSCAKDKNDTPNLPGYKIIEYGNISENTEKPSFINIMFQVTDMQGNGVSTLTTNDFAVLENESPVSPTESAMQIRKQDVVPYSLKTVLLIDNSYSVGDKLSEIKNAAKSLVLSKLPNQEFAIFVFSENPVLLQDFTSDIQTLTSTIDDIDLGFATTNLYGSIVESVNMWEDFYETDQIQQGFLIGFTDGSDTQASSTLEEALAARGQKRVYMVGLGSEIEPSVLEDLGNAGSYSIDNVSELADKFAEIQEDMAGFANSFYWMNYMTPKRGDNEHTLKLYIKDNSNTGEDSYIEDTFNSAGFYSVEQGLYINASESNPYGVAQLEMGEGDTLMLEAVTYLGQNPPSYSWSVDDNTVVSIHETDDPGNYNVEIVADGAAGDQTQVTVSDLSNGLQSSVTINIVESTGTTQGLVAYYDFTDGSTNDDWGTHDGNNNGAEPTTDSQGNADDALAFEGFDYVSVQPSPLNTGAKTVSLFVKFAENDRRQVLLTNTADSQTGDNGFQVVKTASNTLQFMVGNGSSSGYFISAQTSLGITDSEWHHVAMTFTGNSLKGYIDGVQRCSSSSTSGSEGSSSLALRFGGPHEPINTFLNGSLDEIKLFDRALSASEVEELGAR